MKSHFTTLTLVGVALAFTACGETKILGKSLPDETQVIDGPSLALPPSYELRPPRNAQDTAPSSAYAAQVSNQQTAAAQALITGQQAPGAPVSGTVPVTENWILDQAAKQGSTQADPTIREALTADTTSPTEPQPKPAETPATEATPKKSGSWFSRMLGNTHN